MERVTDNRFKMLSWSAGTGTSKHWATFWQFYFSSHKIWVIANAVSSSIEYRTIYLIKLNEHFGYRKALDILVWSHSGNDAFTCVQLIKWNDIPLYTMGLYVNCRYHMYMLVGVFYHHFRLAEEENSSTWLSVISSYLEAHL